MTTTGRTWIVAPDRPQAEYWCHEWDLNVNAVRIVTMKGGLNQMDGYRWTPGLDEVFWIRRDSMTPMVQAVIERGFLQMGCTEEELYENVLNS